MDLQTGGLSRLSVNNRGNIVIQGGSLTDTARVVDVVSNYIGSSGGIQAFRANNLFAPTSGNATLISFLSQPTINQTGGANGITRGLLVNPTLTSAFDFRAIETTLGNVILGSTSGNVGIGITNPTARLDVRAQGALSTDIAFRVRNSAETASLIQVNGLGGVEINSTTQGFLPPRMTTTQKNAIATPVAGLVVYDTTLNKLCVRTASAWETITSI
jgi:hypothetical protein